MGIQHGHLVLHDGFDKQQTPVRADSVWPLLTLENIRKLNGGWQSVPKDILLRLYHKVALVGIEWICIRSVIMNGTE